MKMKNRIEEFKKIVETVPAQLLSISDNESGLRPSGKWSKKEILGHLIDSASNNHQRFVRAQLSDEISLPGYEQDSWVDVQSYNSEEWEKLIQLWKSYNLHLVHLMSQVPEEKLKNRCIIGGAEPVSLEFLMTDYVSHL